MYTRKILNLLVFAAILLVFSLETYGVEIKDLIAADDLARIRDVKTTRTTGILEMGGLTGEMEVIFAAPNKIYTVTDLKILKMVQGFDGEKAWMIDQNGQVLELSGMERRNMVSGAYMTGMSYMIDHRMPGSVAYQKDTTVKEIEYHVFSVLPEDGDSLWIFINTHNHRLEVVRERLDEIDVMTYMSDFRTVEGIEVPFVSTTESDIPQLNTVITTTAFEINVPVDQSLFEVAVAGDDDYHFPEGEDSVMVPFEIYAGHIYLRVSIDGLPEGKFILDSGAGTNVLDKTYAENIGLETGGEVAAKGVSGYGTAALAEIDSLSVGGVTIFNQVVGIIDLAGLGFEAADSLAGIMGFDLMQRFPFRLDFKDSLLVFYNPGTFTPPDPKQSVAFELFMKIPMVKAQYDDVEGNFIVDFGNALGLILHRSFIEEHELDSTLSEVSEMSGRVGGVGGGADAVAAVGTSFKVGPAEIRNPTLMVAGGSGGLLDSKQVDGNIGNLVLRDFSVLMDYKNKKMYILPLP